MATTYEPINTNTVSGTTTTTITFSSIPQTYTDLVLVCSGNSITATDYPRLRIGTASSISSTGYSDTQLVGNGTAASSARELSQTGIIFATYPNTTSPVMTTFNFMNYSNTTIYKTFLIRDDNAVGNVTAEVALWQNTGAINIMELFITNKFVAGSTFTLYGIKAA